MMTGDEVKKCRPVERIGVCIDKPLLVNPTSIQGLFTAISGGLFLVQRPMQRPEVSRCARLLSD